MSKVKNHVSNTDKAAMKTVTKELLLLGGEGAGKTLLSRRLGECNMNFVSITPENTVPTTGTDIIDLNINGNDISCREVGSAMSSSWVKYIFTSWYILFVVDISDPGSYPSAFIHMTEILNCLKSESIEKNCAAPTVLIIFNKTDMADPASHALAMNVFHLGDVISQYKSSERNIQIFSGNCMNLQLAKVVLKWISNDSAES